MTSATIIQPGQLGDILILLPIAKKLVEEGYSVSWPVHQPFVKQLEQAVSFPITFVPVVTLNYAESIQHATGRIVDVHFGLPGQPKRTQEWIASGLTFDAYKYKLAGYPLDLKFTLANCINRNRTREEALFTLFQDRLGSLDDYCFVSNRTSDCPYDLSRFLPKDKKHVFMTKETDSIFDWLLLMEKASSFVMVDSAPVNLAAGMTFQQPGIRVWRGFCYNSERYYPQLLPNWKTEK